MIMEIELQSQVLDAMNYVLYEQLKFKGNRMDYYNALNLYMHQVSVDVFLKEKRTSIVVDSLHPYTTEEQKHFEKLIAVFIVDVCHLVLIS
jgi:hypothetical protein